jgi:pimeloyl-ACP methyl ester carboxylesterase
MSGATSTSTAVSASELALPGDRKLGYLVLGDPDAATTVVVLDGPGSRGLARAADAVGRRQGVRLVAPDRPGWLGSTPRPGATYADVARDVLALADHLGAERFGILAQSGGTPFAVALAGIAGDRVTGLAFVGGIVPLGEKHAIDDVRGDMRTTFRLARRAPFLLAPLMRSMARQVRRDPDRLARRVVDKAPAADRRVMEDPAMYAIHRTSTIEALSAPDAFAREARNLARPWGVEFGAVRCPVALWVGEEDHTHPVSMARDLAVRLGDAPVRVVPEAGTFAMGQVYGDAVAFASGAAV